MMIYKGYIGRVEFDPEAKILSGEVIGIRDVITFQADSAAGVEREFRKSVDDYLAFCAERGEKPEKPASGKFVLRLSSELHGQLTMIAEASKVSLNSLAESLLATGAEEKLKSYAQVAPKNSRTLRTPLPRQNKRELATA
jgi:predicted HicB family RNase H-like nuclease